MQPRFDNPVIETTDYMISPFPLNHPRTRYFGVTIRRRLRADAPMDLWSIYQTGYIFVLNEGSDTEGDYEPDHSGIPSERSQFDLGTAFALATASLPTITVNGFRADGSAWNYVGAEGGSREWVMVDPPGTHSHRR